MLDSPMPALAPARRATKAQQVIYLQTQIRAAQHRVDNLSDQLVRVISTPDARV